MEGKGNIETLATKRIPVTKSTMESLYNLKRFGQTYDELLQELIATQQKVNLETDLDAAAKEPSIPLDEAEKALGIKK